MNYYPNFIINTLFIIQVLVFSLPSYSKGVGEIGVVSLDNENCLASGDFYFNFDEEDYVATLISNIDFTPADKQVMKCDFGNVENIEDIYPCAPASVTDKCDIIFLSEIINLGISVTDEELEQNDLFFKIWGEETFYLPGFSDKILCPSPTNPQELKPTETTTYQINVDYSDDICPPRSVKYKDHEVIPEIFIQYPFLTDLVDPNNCTSEYVLELTSGSSIYLYVSDGIHMSIYTDSGDFYCTNFTGFSCMDYYNLTTTGKFWGCNDNILNINICVGDTAFIPGLSMLPFGPQGTPCSSGTCNVVTEISIIPSENVTQQGIEGFTVSPSVSTVYFITSTATQQNGAPLPPDPDCAFVPPCQTVSETVTYFVNIVYEDCGDPIDCSMYSGTVFSEDCDDGAEHIFIETDDGQIIDPYNGPNVVFNYMDGQNVKFDYQEASFQTPCSIADKAVLLNCIEEINRPNPGGIFEEYPWMTDHIDLENCDGTEYIQKFDQGSSSFFYFGSAGFGILYYEDGTLYCIDATNFSCLDEYGLIGGEIVWACEDIPIDPDCSYFSGRIFFDECDDGTEYFFIEASDGTIFDPYYLDGIEFNHFDGQNINFDYLDASFPSPCTLADQAIVITCIEDAGTTPPSNEIFDDYPFLNGIINFHNCEATTIEIFDNGSYAFIFVSSPDSSILYYEDGTVYCLNSVNFSCLDAYGLTSGQIVWACGDVSNTPDCSNYSGTIFFDECDDGTEYFFIETTDGRILDPYYEDGIEFNHSDGQNINFDYRDAGFQSPCSIAQQAITIICIEEAEENPEGIFEDFPWLEDEIQYNDCEFSGHYILQFDQGDYSYFYFGGIGLGNTYDEDGNLICIDWFNGSCIDSYGLTDGEIVFSCGDISFLNNPNCYSHAGTVIINECELYEEFYYIETTDGTILDPFIVYSDFGIEFYEGQKVIFDYVEVDFPSPCPSENKFVEITCIEEVGLIEECECDPVYDPVYDAEGNEYTNACYADCHGVLYYFDYVFKICEGETITLTPEQPSFQDCADIPTLNITWDINPPNCPTGDCISVTLTPRETSSYVSTVTLTSCGTIGGGPAGPLQFVTTEFLVVVDPDCEIDEACDCNESYDPVYDEDGNEYRNPCFAECAGVEYYSQVITICEGESTTLFADQFNIAGGCAPYEWFEWGHLDWPFDLVSTIVSPTSTTTYSVTTTLKGCGASNSITKTFLVTVDSECELDNECNCNEYYDPVYDAEGNEYTNTCIADCEGVEEYYDQVITICEGRSVILYADQPSIQGCGDVPTILNEWDHDDPNCPFPFNCGSTIVTPASTTTYNAVTILICGSGSYDSTTFLVIVGPNCLFTDYPWINDEVDQANCYGTSINVYDNGNYAYIYISTPNDGGILYYEDGSIYCTESSGLDCLQAYSLSNPTNSWNCSTSNFETENSDDINSSLEVFPNPTTDILNVVYENEYNLESSIIIYDLIGNKIIEQQFEPDLDRIETEFDLSRNQVGFYILEKRMGQQIEIQKVILN